MPRFSTHRLSMGVEPTPVWYNIIIRAYERATLRIVVGEEQAMNPTMKDLGIDWLNPEQRVILAMELWESLDDSRPLGSLTTEQRAELKRRDTELNANPEIALTWEQIRASVEAKP